MEYSIGELLLYLLMHPILFGTQSAHKINFMVSYVDKLTQAYLKSQIDSGCSPVLFKRKFGKRINRTQAA